jgi:hypothetical protein
MMAPRAYQSLLDGEDASSPAAVFEDPRENASSVFALSRLHDGDQDTDPITPSPVADVSVQAAPETSTASFRAYPTSQIQGDVSSTTALAFGQEESKMDDTTKEWVATKLEAAQERTNTQLANLQSRLDIGIVRLESHVNMISNNVQQLVDAVKGIHADGRETRAEIDRLSGKIDEAEKETRKELYEIKTQNANTQAQNASIHTSMLMWYVGTTIVLFLALVAVATFGKDMFEWGQHLRQ